MRFPALTPAKLDWKEGTPFSASFDDIYFSKAGGADETRHVFLQGNQLPERWEHCSHFTIAETGFGTGLNFLVTWQEWLRHAPDGATLHYISIELHPLCAEDLARCHIHWPGLIEFAQALRDVWPPALPGFHTLHLAGGRITLTVLFGDAATLLAELNMQDTHVDAWFLDGFAPSGNPDMWNDNLFAQVKRLSAPGTTAATYTVAGKARRGLQAAGFTLHRQPGYGGKREMLSAHYGTPPNDALPSPAPITHTTADSVIIIGAGLAGASAAHALTRRNIPVTLIDAASHTAGGASGNPAAVLIPYFINDWNARCRFYTAGFTYSSALLEQLRHTATPTIGERCGVLEIAVTDTIAARQQKYQQLGLPADIMRSVSAAEASELSGVTITQDGMWYASGRWVDMQQWCNALLPTASSSFTTHYGMDVQDIRPTTNGWAVYDDNDTLIASAPRVIIATAAGARHLPVTSALPLQVVRGQVTRINADASSKPLRTILKYEGYCTPAIEGRHVLGSTYEIKNDVPAISTSDHLANLNHLRALLPDFAHNTAPESLEGWAAIRCASRDHMPIVGELKPGLYTSLAHGSRGAFSCPLAGEILACQLTDKPLPIDAHTCKTLSPARFT